LVVGSICEIKHYNIKHIKYVVIVILYPGILKKQLCLSINFRKYN